MNIIFHTFCISFCFKVIKLNLFYYIFLSVKYYIIYCIFILITVKIMMKKIKYFFYQISMIKSYC